MRIFQEINTLTDFLRSLKMSTERLLSKISQREDTTWSLKLEVLSKKPKKTSRCHPSSIASSLLPEKSSGSRLRKN